MSEKQLWILVGGNGAGKTTYYNTQLKKYGIPFINADLIAKEVYPDDPEGNSYSAARLAEERRESLLVEGRSFCFETVFSHPTKVDFVAKAKGYGYKIHMVVVHLQDDQLNQARVAQRVSKGGHDVPTNKIITRIPRTLSNIKVAIKLCDYVLLLDNSLQTNPFEVAAIIKPGKQDIRKNHRWVNELLGEP